MEASNVKAMREALKMFVDAYNTTSYTLCIENLRPAFQKAKAALAKPPRNCDLPYNDSVEIRHVQGLAQSQGSYNGANACL